MKTIISQKLAEVVGPYCHAVAAGPFLFVSGMGPFDPKSGQIIGSTMAQQTKQALENLQAVLSEAGLTLKDLVKTTCYLSDLNLFGEFNQVYAEFMGPHRPARATVQVAKLFNDMFIEVESVALLK
ncbi:MAG: Rid family detoxifying hydrolase [Deltaproteobacteria bacterium]|jgi:2-iminobutanoate/2-iminopropanoate deaminase|nr:Rid family detoxifying hydrolase [Deltaproteobacteria bacterium]